MSDQYPFSGPFAPGGAFGGNPIDDPDNRGPRCPKCKSQKFDAFTNQFGLIRTCQECGNQWSGGTMAVARQDYLERPPPPGIAPPDDPIIEQYTGASFRDPSKSFGDDEF